MQRNNLIRARRDETQRRRWGCLTPYLARRIFLILITVSVLLLLAVATSWIDQQAKALTTVERVPIGRTPLDYDWPYEDVTLTTQDGLELSGWYITGTRPQAVVVVHGFFANKQYSLPIGSMLARYGYHVLLIDLRGHGESQGSQITFGYKESLDVQAAIAYLQSIPTVEQIGAVGYSAGGAAVIRAAANNENLGPLVIISSYSSLPAAINDSFDKFSNLPQWLFAPLIVKSNEWRTGIHIEDVDSVRSLVDLSPRPILIMHSRDDNLFPIEHAYRLYEAAPCPKELFLMRGYKHDDPALYYKDDYQKYIVKFFDNAFLYAP